MITKKQGKAYATIALDLLYKMKVKVTPESFENQLDLTYDLYDCNEVEDIYQNMMQNNKIINKNMRGKANLYVVNLYNSSKTQIELFRKFCKDNIEIGKMYITPPGENADNYYELIKDIRNKNMDILLMNIFTILGMSERERGIIVHLCRENDVMLIEI